MSWRRSGAKEQPAGGGSGAGRRCIREPGAVGRGRRFGLSKETTRRVARGEDAESRAEWAEADARDAIAFAGNAIDEAEYAMLDAILARKDASVLAEAPSLRST
jgi:hypothetical protein